MELKPDTEAALDAWVGRNTWYTDHTIDMNRWYDFVDQYQKDHGFIIDEDGLREIVERKVKDGVNDQLREIIRDRISLAYKILEFLKHTKR